MDAEAFELAQTAAYSNLLAVIWRHKSLVVLGLAVGIVLGALYYSRQPPVYQSGAQLIVIKKQGNPLPQDQDVHGGLVDDYLSIHQTLMKSPVIVRDASRKDALKGLKSFQSGDPTYAIIGGLSVTRESKDSSSYSNVLNLAFTCGNPDDCPVVVNSVIEAYKEWLNKKYRTVSGEALTQVANATNTLQKKLDEQEAKYEEFRQQNPLVIVTTGGETRSLHENWLLGIQSKKLDLLGVRAQLKGRLAVLEKANKEGRGRQELMTQLQARPIGASGAANDARFSERLFDLELQLALARADYGQDHPEIKKLKTKLDLTRNFFKGLSADPDRPEGITDPVELHMLGLGEEIKNIEVNVRSLEDLLDSEQERAGEVLRYINEDKHLREDISRTRGLFEPLIQRLKAFELTQDLGGFDAEIIAEPTRGFQVAPNLSRILVVAAFLGLLGGFGLAYLADLMDKSFRTPEEIRRRLGVPVIGHIPIIGTDATSIAAAAESGDLDPRLCTFYQSKSYQAEAFRGLRTALYFSTQGEVHKVIQITSPQASDGKSTLVANLAISIAQSGKRVVLIDADLRKPRLHKIFGVSNVTGLASIITHESELKDTIQKTPVPGLSLVPCGPRPSNPAELLTSQTFKDLLDTIREEFDFVLIDTPPLLAVSDPSVVAPRVDGVVLAIRVSKNGRPNAERAREILKTLGANLLGVVVNGAGTGPGKYGYGYNYRYNYGYAYNYNYNYAYSYQSYSGYYEDEAAANGPGVSPDAAAPVGDVPEVTSNGGNGHHHGDGGEAEKSGLLSRFFRRGK
jgi:polysaccharide biosynthesis transport protein